MSSSSSKELKSYLTWSQTISALPQPTAAPLPFFSTSTQHSLSIKPTTSGYTIAQGTRHSIPPSQLLGSILSVEESVPPSLLPESEKPYGVVEGRVVVWDGAEEDGEVIGEGSIPSQHLSILPLLVEKVTSPARKWKLPSLQEPGMTEESVHKLCAFVRRKIRAHRGATDMKMSVEEEEWLVEKLVWFGMFPGSKNYEFPGKRPENPERDQDNQIQTGTPLPCTTCSAYGVRNEECPLVETRKCPEHGQYDVRLGFENFEGEECPGCELEAEEGSDDEDFDWEAFVKEEEEKRRVEAAEATKVELQVIEPKQQVEKQIQVHVQKLGTPDPLVKREREVEEEQGEGDQSKFARHWYNAVRTVALMY